MTLATAMYYTGLDPLSKDAVFVAKDWKDRKIQQALLQPKRHEHKKHLPQKPEQRSPANSKRGR
jgi:hypothetical protein